MWVFNRGSHFVVILCFIFLSGLAHAGDRALTDQQWREDLKQAVTAIREIHFKPFTQVPETAFDAAVSSLNESIPQKSDAEIIVSMAKIVALLRDGHTRLHLPRQHPDLALEAELGHGGTAPPKIEALRFSQLPVRFELFADGLFVIGATEQHRALVGHRVIAFDEMPVEEAIERVRATSFHENDQRAKLIAPDRLALPQVLSILGITASSDRLRLTTQKGDTAHQQTVLKPMGPDDQIRLADGVLSPLWQRHRNRHEWFKVLPENDAIYVQVNQFAENPPRPYSVFVAETLGAAREAGVSRYVIDLRHNTGGIGAWTIPFITGLSRSEYNQYGQLYVLMGRSTYSAAQHLLHKFEEYSNAIFVGEPGGASPSHFSDPRRVVLDHSGLTLRVSTLYWHSWLANEFRDAIDPHIDAPMTSTDYLAGRDPALKSALAYLAPSSLALQVAEQLRKDKVQNGLLQYQRFQTDGSLTNHHAAVPELISVAHGLLDDGLIRPGYFMLFLTNRDFPGNADALAGLGRAHELMDQADDALKSYQAALELDPQQVLALEGLARIGITE